MTPYMKFVVIMLFVVCVVVTMYLCMLVTIGKT